MSEGPAMSSELDLLRVGVSEATARAFLEAAAEGVIVVDRAGHIALVNARAELMFGYPRGELLGQSLELLVPERVRQAHVAHRATYFAEPRARRMGGELVRAGRRKVGSDVPVASGLRYRDAQRRRV